MKRTNYDVLVIGAGIAGLLAARLFTQKNYSVIVITMSQMGSGASFYPLKSTLGIQISDTSYQEKEYFKKDFIRVANGVLDTEKMNIYVNESNGRQELLRLIGFDPQLRLDNRPACFAQYSRPIYLIKDWDKARAEIYKKFKENQIAFLEGFRVIKLFKNNNKICAVLLISASGYLFIDAKIVIIAAGGVAGLFKHNLYPADVDGSMWALAHDVGAQLINTQFIQFIPSFLKPKYKILFGEHTIKYITGVFDSTGKDLFSDLTPNQKEELFFERSTYAPFSVDYKSSMFDIRIAKAGGNGAHIEYSPQLYKDQEAFYTIYLNWLTDTVKINLLTDSVFIAPFAHSANGGIKVSSYGETAIKGLYAVGEAACGIEGANRMGGNSIGSIVVFVPRMVEKAVEYLNHHQSDAIDFLPLAEEFIAKTKRVKCSGFPPHILKKELSHILYQHASIVRTKKGLAAVLEWIYKIKNIYGIVPEYENPAGYGMLSALDTAQLIIKDMIKQKKSIGSHYREDFQKIY